MSRWPAILIKVGVGALPGGGFGGATDNEAPVELRVETPGVPQAGAGPPCKPLVRSSASADGTPRSVSRPWYGSFPILPPQTLGASWSRAGVPSGKDDSPIRRTGLAQR